MVTVLTNEHYTIIRNFSRKISKGVNSDDLSQHVILKLLQKSNRFIKHLIEENDFNRYVWQFIKLMHNQDHSTFNREEYGTHHRENVIKTIPIDSLNIVYDSGLFKDDECDLNNKFRSSMSYKGICSTDTMGYDKDFIKGVIKKAGLTDIERMYLNAYVESGLSYTKCSSDLDISRQAISKHVKKAIEKCKNSL